MTEDKERMEALRLEKSNRVEELIATFGAEPLDLEEARNYMADKYFSMKCLALLLQRELSLIGAVETKLRKDLVTWYWVLESARTNKDHAVIVRVMPDGNLSFLHGDPTQELERELAAWQKQHADASAEAFRLAELLRKADPSWGSPMHLNTSDDSRTNSGPGGPAVAGQVRITEVVGADGRPVAAPCAISGCQYNMRIDPRYQGDDPAAEYAKRNPLGGPAGVFRAMAARIEAGEEYYSVLDDYGFSVVNTLSAPDIVPSTSKESK